MMNTKLRILVIGTGSIGERHVRCLLATGRADVGICETSINLRERIAAQYLVFDTFASVDEAIGGAKWDGAVIATPAHTHIPLGIQLIEAGITPLIEKPLAIETDGVEALKQAAQQRGIVPGIAYVLRSHPAAWAMRQAIITGRFGLPRQVISYSGHYFAEARPAYRDIYFADRMRGGGAIQDAITHTLNLSEWFVGPITQVRADAGHQQLEGVDVEDTVHVIARHGDVLGCHTLNLYQAPPETTVTVICDKGTARLELHKHRWRWMQEAGTLWCDEPANISSRDAYFTLQEHAYLDQIEHCKSPLCTLTEAAQTLRVIIAVLESADNNIGWVAVE